MEEKMAKSKETKANVPPWAKGGKHSKNRNLFPVFLFINNV